MWPVGQAVKTGASHAPNVGSIPARVTKAKRELISTISSVGRAPGDARKDVQIARRKSGNRNLCTESGAPGRSKGQGKSWLRNKHH